MIATTLALLGGLIPTAEPSKAARMEYVAKLTATEPTAEAQYKLAMWARRVGLAEEADGHLRASAYLDPGFAHAQKALGRTLKGGRWESKEERRARLAEESQLRCEREDVLKQLRESGIESALGTRPLGEAAVAALEEYVAHDEARSLAAAKLLRASRGGAATMGLVRLAVLSRYEKARTAAADALAERNPDHYLPNLVEFVRPMASRVETVLGVGEVWRWQEGDRLFVAVPAPPREQESAASVRANSGSTLDLSDQAAQRQDGADFRCGNAAAALRRLTGETFGPDHEAWRNVAMQIIKEPLARERPGVRAVEWSQYEPDKMVIGSLALASGAPGDS